MRAVRARVGLAVTLFAQLWLLARAWERPVSASGNLQWALVALVLFVVAVWLLARCALPPRAAVLVIVGVGALLQLLALSKPPRTSDDDFRYAWDAKVQLAGIDPYRYVPVAPELSRLHDRFLFGPGSGHCAGEVCTRVNHPEAHTVYPPVAEGAFTALRAVSFGGHGGHLPLQLAAAAGAVAVAWLLSRQVLSRGRPMWLVAIWAWCPVTVSEFSNNAHIDWLGVLLVVLAFSAAARRRDGWAGALVGAAIGVKLYPALVLPSLVRRRPWVVLGASVAVVALSYLPHVLAVGGDVIGFLPGYLHEEQYVSGDRLKLLGLVLPHPLDSVVGVMVLGAVALWAWRRGDPSVPERSAVVVVGTAFLVATPNYGWYAALLLALIVASGAVEWLPVALAPTVTYLYRGVHLHTGVPSSVIYFVAGCIAAAGYLLRRADSLRSCRQFASSSTGHSPSSPSTARH